MLRFLKKLFRVRRELTDAEKKIAQSTINWDQVFFDAYTGSKRPEIYKGTYAKETYRDAEKTHP